MFTLGLENKLRELVKESINLIKYGVKVVDVEKKQKNTVNIRMVSGDHIETCRWAALKSGIINEKEMNDKMVVMTGAIFRDKIGSDNFKIEEDGQFEWTPNSSQNTGKAEFHRIKKKLRVLARATDQDKMILIQGIRAEGGLILMSGDCINDARALQAADVGIAMGTGCSVTKQKAHLVILDNDFLSIYHAVMWGRTLF